MQYLHQACIYRADSELLDRDPRTNSEASREGQSSTKKCRGKTFKNLLQELQRYI